MYPYPYVSVEGEKSCVLQDAIIRTVASSEYIDARGCY